MSYCQNQMREANSFQSFLPSFLAFFPSFPPSPDVERLVLGPLKQQCNFPCRAMSISKDGVSQIDGCGPSPIMSIVLALIRDQCLLQPYHKCYTPYDLLTSHRDELTKCFLNMPLNFPSRLGAPTMGMSFLSLEFSAFFGANGSLLS